MEQPDMTSPTPLCWALMQTQHDALVAVQTLFERLVKARQLPRRTRHQAAWACTQRTVQHALAVYAASQPSPCTDWIGERLTVPPGMRSILPLLRQWQAYDDRCLALGAAITAQIEQYAQTHDDAAQWLDALQACGVWGYATYLVRRILQAQEPPTTRLDRHDVLESEDTTHVQYGA
jgi:hypothetical protein